MEKKLSLSQKKKFEGKNGFSTKFFGPRLWDTLFTMVLGSYPSELNPENPEHMKIKKAFVTTFCNLKYLLPCSFCRLSYKEFYSSLPIEPYTSSRIDMMYWLYLLKDKVNKKLIRQEMDYLTDLYSQYRKGKISKEEYIINTKKCFSTEPSPPFIQVLEKYEKNRAVCNKKLKKCISKK